MCMFAPADFADLINMVSISTLFAFWIVALALLWYRCFPAAKHSVHAPRGEVNHIVFGADLHGGGLRGYVRGLFAATIHAHLPIAMYSGRRHCRTVHTLYAIQCKLQPCVYQSMYRALLRMTLFCTTSCVRPLGSLNDPPMYPPDISRTPPPRGGGAASRTSLR